MKLVAEVGVGTIAAGVAKAHADVVLITGHDGGTGASPQTSITHAGLPWELGLAEAHQTLVLNNLRSRIAVETDGQLKTGRDVAIAALLGAEEFGFATAPLVATGCIMMRVCHLNTCPAGVATQDPRLREKFKGKPEHVVNFMQFIAMELREIMAQLGFRTIEEMVGRVDKLEARKAVAPLEGEGPRPLEPAVLARSRSGLGPLQPGAAGSRHRALARHDDAAWSCADPRIERGEEVVAEAADPQRQSRRRHDHRQRDHAQARREGPAARTRSACTSSARRARASAPSCRAGMTLSLEGDANDYVGKGLSGGKIAVFPPPNSTFVAEDNIIVGNVALYGATSGEAYIRGMAGERFCVRNSGVERRRRGRGRSRLRVHDRRPRRRARFDRAQLRRRHVGRHRLRARRARRLRRARQQADGQPRAPRPTPPRSPTCAA